MQALKLNREREREKERERERERERYTSRYIIYAVRRGSPPPYFYTFKKQTRSSMGSLKSFRKCGCVIHPRSLSCYMTTTKRRRNLLSQPSSLHRHVAVLRLLELDRPSRIELIGQMCSSPVAAVLRQQPDVQQPNGQQVPCVLCVLGRTFRFLAFRTA